MVGSGRAPSGQALVSDQAPEGLDPSGFDPSRFTERDVQRVADAIRAAQLNERWGTGNEYRLHLARAAIAEVAAVLGART